MDRRKRFKEYLKKSLRGRTALSWCFTLIVVIGSIYVLNPFKSDAQPSNEKIYRIKSRYSGKYLDVPYSSFDAGTHIKLYDNNGGNLNQLFSITPSSQSGYYTIKNINSLLVFDVYGESNNNNEAIIQYYQANKPNQQFAFEKQSDGAYKVKIRSSGKYLTIKSDSKDSGAELVQWPYKTSGADNQAWILEEVQNPFKNINDYVYYKYVTIGDRDNNRIINGAKLLGFKETPNEVQNVIDKVKKDIMPSAAKIYNVKSGYSQLYWDVPYSSLNPNVEIELYTKNNAPNQMFRIMPAKDAGFYHIINSNSGLYLDLAGDNNNKNANVVQYYPKGQYNQQFAFKLEKGGKFKIMARHSGQYLTIESDNKNPRAKLVQWPYKTEGANNQDWYLEPVSNPYSSLDAYISKRVNSDKIISTPLILKGAIGFGFDTTSKEVEDKVNALLNKQADKIFTDNTGFITTYGMLNKRVDQIGFAGAHNAFSNNKDRRSSYAWDTYKTDHNVGTENHDISIGTMLAVGYRVIDLDIGDNGNGKTGSYHRYRLSGYSNLNGNNAILPKIKKFLDDNPSEIAIIHISDVYNGTIDLTKLKNSSTYHKGESGYLKQFNNMITDMRDTGLLDMTYNFKGSGSTPYDKLYSSMDIPGKDIPWPTLKEMIQTNKRVLFLERDSGIAVDVPFKNQNGDPNNTTKANLNLSQSWIDGLKGGSKNRLINITFTEDWGASAGDKNAAKINNNGVRIFDIINSVDKTLIDKGVDKVVNVVYVDYATGNKKQGGWIDVSPVDAVNRENYTNFGYPWSAETAGRWYWK